MAPDVVVLVQCIGCPAGRPTVHAGGGLHSLVLDGVKEPAAFTLAKNASFDSI